VDVANHSIGALRERVTAARSQLNQATANAKTCARLARGPRSSASAARATDALIEANGAVQDAAATYLLAVDEYLSGFKREPA
jgi:multidrug resistance efflux pump